MSGKMKSAVITQSAETKVKVTKADVRGSTNTSQVIGNVFNNSELTIIIQGRLVPFLAACPMVVGLVRPRRFPFMEPPSWMKMLSHTQVSFDIYVE